MPVFVAALIGGLVQAATSITGRVLIALGIGFVAYEGIDTALGALKTLLITNISALPPTVIALLGYLKVDVAISMIFSAYVARLAIMGLTSGVVKRMVVK